jgi:hypothetical protein
MIYVIARRVFLPTKQSSHESEIASGTPALAGSAKEEQERPRNDMTFLNLIQRTTQPGFGFVDVGENLHRRGGFWQ